MDTEGLTLKFTGERVVPTDMPADAVHILMEHIARYNFALKYCYHKRVLDAACGAGYGTDLLRNVGQVTGWDIAMDALLHARRYYQSDNRFDKFEQKDLNDLYSLRGEFDPKYDLTVSFETIEHLTNWRGFIQWTKDNTGGLICSIPYRVPSRFHISDSDEHFAEMVAHLQDVYPDIEFFYQQGVNFYDKPDLSWSHYYLIGVAV